MLNLGISFLVILALLPVLTTAKSCDGYNLEPDADVRVGTILKKKCSQANRSKQGQWLRMHYSEKMYSTCKEIYNTRTKYPKEGFVFQLGSRDNLSAINKGVENMCVGEKRKIAVPASYGKWAMEVKVKSDNDSASETFIIPANSTITFEVELLAINDASEVPEDFLNGEIHADTTQFRISDDHMGALRNSEEEFGRIMLTVPMVSDEWLYENRALLEVHKKKHIEAEELKNQNRKRKGMEVEVDKHAESIKLLEERLSRMEDRDL